MMEPVTDRINYPIYDVMRIMFPTEARSYFYHIGALTGNEDGLTFLAFINNSFMFVESKKSMNYDAIDNNKFGVNAALNLFEDE